MTSMHGQRITLAQRKKTTSLQNSHLPIVHGSPKSISQTPELILLRCIASPRPVDKLLAKASSLRVAGVNYSAQSYIPTSVSNSLKRKRKHPPRPLTWKLISSLFRKPYVSTKTLPVYISSHMPCCGRLRCTPTRSPASTSTHTGIELTRRLLH